MATAIPRGDRHTAWRPPYRVMYAMHGGLDPYDRKAWVWAAMWVSVIAAERRNTARLRPLPQEAPAVSRLARKAPRAPERSIVGA